MKKAISIFLILSMLLASFLLSSCDGTTEPTAETSGMQIIPTVQPTEETPILPEPVLMQTVEEMAELENVISVEKLDDFCSVSELAYKVEFESDGLKRYFELVLPADYAEKDYPTILYFPDVEHEVSFLVDNFAKKDVIVVRLFYRGTNGNEGMKDYCGKDYIDVENLLSLCLSCDFLSNGGIVTAGAAMASVYALRLTADYPDAIIGCAAVDVVFDYESFADFRGDGVRALFLALFECGEDDFSKECAARSPKYFVNSITDPILMFSYEASPIMPKEQSEMLKAMLDENGCETELIYLDPVRSDFNGTAFLKLIPWIKALSEENQ